MSDYIAICKGEATKSVSVCFYNEEPKILAIGEKMNEINADAYMNGYNWAALIEHYLAKNEPDLLTDMDSDPEGGMYAAIYPLTPKNELRAQRLAEVIRSLVEQEEELYRIVTEEADEIEWD